MTKIDLTVHFSKTFKALVRLQKMIVLEQDILCKWRIKPKELKEVTEVSKSIVEYQLLYNAIGINQFKVNYGTPTL